MEKRRLVVVFVIAVALLCSESFAGGPLGPPRAFVGQGKWLVDIEYAYESIDLKASGKMISNVGGPYDWRYKIENLRSNMFFGSLAYGLSENWDVFTRLGAADASDEIKPSINEGYGEKYCYDGGYGFAGGIGTRATFCRCGPYTFGAIGQLTWFYPGDAEDTFAFAADDVKSAKFGADWRQYQFGIGVTYQAEGWWIYGGPCFLLVNGNLDVDAVETYTETYTDKGRLDLREESEFGGWIGVGCNLPQKGATCYAECQIYDYGWAIGAGVLFPLAVH